MKCKRHTILLNAEQLAVKRKTRYHIRLVHRAGKQHEKDTVRRNQIQQQQKPNTLTSHTDARCIINCVKCRARDCSNDRAELAKDF